jgi:hypothetical protein
VFYLRARSFRERGLRVVTLPEDRSDFKPEPKVCLFRSEL